MFFGGKKSQVICLSRPAPFVKIFLFPFDPNHFSIRGHPGPHKGAFRDRHERKVGMRWTRSGATDESAYLRTAKSCGPDAPTLASSSRGAELLRGEGGNKARSPGRARRKPLKPSRAGMPGDSGATVVTNARAYYSTRAAAGASGTRHSPRPLLGGAQLGRHASRGCSRPSSPAKAGDPVFRDVSDRTEKLRHTGYSAFAEYDDFI